jgi:quinoprotein glucose dehydrogenase
MKRQLLVLAGAAAIIANITAVGAGQEPARPRSVLDGVYTPAQAARGRAAYAEYCARCHRDDLQGNPEAMPLTGARFTETWREDSLVSLFDHMATRMPREPRTTLPTPVYVDILAFILQFNGYPPGDGELTAGNLREVTFVGLDGPQPLPNLAVVRIVGCFTPAGTGTWSLTHATEPARDRDGRATTPEQLAASGRASLGGRTFALQNLDYLREGFTPDPYIGQRVQVKGALVRRQADERVSVTSLETVTASCP